MKDFHGKNNSNYKHGGKGTRLFHIWIDMRQRCNNPHNYAYKNYGERGISVYPEWNDYVNFRNWAEMNGYTNDLTLDRINVNGNYEPNNCRWVTRKVQNNNRRSNRLITYKGETKNLREWSDMLCMNYDKLRYRLDTWKDVNRAFEEE